MSTPTSRRVSCPAGIIFDPLACRYREVRIPHHDYMLPVIFPLISDEAPLLRDSALTIRHFYRRVIGSVRAGVLTSTVEGDCAASSHLIEPHDTRRYRGSHKICSTVEDGEHRDIRYVHPGETRPQRMVAGNNFLHLVDETRVCVLVRWSRQTNYRTTQTLLAVFMEPCE